MSFDKIYFGKTTASGVRLLFKQGVKQHTQ